MAWGRVRTELELDRKNSLNLLQAFAQGHHTYPQAQLAIVGGATLFDYQPYREQFFALAQSLGLHPGVDLILPGVIAAADLPTPYRCAQGVCFPSHREGWGLVVLEAIACGLPVILSHWTRTTPAFPSPQPMGQEDRLELGKSPRFPTMLPTGAGDGVG